jgi:hypothetical protein
MVRFSAAGMRVTPDRLILADGMMISYRHKKRRSSTTASPDRSGEA